MDDLGRINVGIVNALVKLTQAGKASWVSKTFGESTNECYVPIGSTMVKYTTTALGRQVALFVQGGKPTHIRMEGVVLLQSSDFVHELTIPPLKALHQAIAGSAENLKIQTREEFLKALERSMSGNNSDGSSIDGPL